MTLFTAESTKYRRFRLGSWHVDPAAGTISSDARALTLEPKMMDLLCYLADHPGEVVTRRTLDEALWPDVTVGEDVLSRTISKLRKALGDDAGDPRFIETLPKRGYRLIAPVTSQVSAENPSLQTKRARPYWAFAALLFLAGIVVIGLSQRQAAPTSPALSEAERLTDRADELYMNFTRADNEAAIALYDRAIAEAPGYGPAQAGLANAFVQRVVRWSEPQDQSGANPSLTRAIESDLTSQPDPRATLDRAVQLAERAVRSNANDAAAHKALGFAYAASSRRKDAIRAFRKAIELDPNAWDAWVNLGEALDMESDGSGLRSFISAYEAMERRYAERPETVGAWLAPVGIYIADRIEQSGDALEAERWYGRVLERTPFEPEATARLARLKIQSGDRVAARQLCANLEARIGTTPSCTAVLAELGPQ